MGIVKSIKKVFKKGNGTNEDRLKNLKGLSKEQAEKKIGVLLHEICVKYAADFVKEELNRGESPFSEVPKSRFFHEVMLINLWIIDKVLGEKRRAIIDETQKEYNKFFNLSGNSEEISGRFRTYYNSWDDHSGFHDEFGVKASENIFGRETGIPFAQTSFWIISYTDKTMKEFVKLKKSCKDAGVKI